MKLIHISVLMALPQQWLISQAKESLSSQPVEESVQKTGAIFQPRLMKMKDLALGCWQLPLAEGHKNDKQKHWKKKVNHSRKTTSILFCPEVFHYNHKL